MCRFHVGSSRVILTAIIKVQSPPLFLVPFNFFNDIEEMISCKIIEVRNIKLELLLASLFTMNWQ